MSLLDGEQVQMDNLNSIMNDDQKKQQKQIRINTQHPITRIERVLHPVGQGAFYSESFYDAKGQKCRTVVYDCGSTPKTYVKEEIDSFFSKGDVIDILFISHFDNDHISGLEKLKKTCTIDTVVMPLLNSVQKIYMLSNGVNKTLITNPESFFANSRVVFVQPTNLDNPEEQTVNQDIQYANLASLADPKCLINNADRIVFESYWVYIPCNYDYTQRRTKLIDNIKKLDEFANVDFENKAQIDDIVKTADKALLGRINKIFKDMMPDGANRISMMLYSGPSQSTKGIFAQCELNLFKDSAILNKLYVGTAALYLGDTDLNQSDILEQLSNDIGQLKENIVILQLPHHGSKKNFNDGLLSFGDRDSKKIFFSSFGTNNRYGHPSNSVICKVIASGQKIVMVTEMKNSTIIQSIF